MSARGFLKGDASANICVHGSLGKALSLFRLGVEVLGLGSTVLLELARADDILRL